MSAVLILLLIIVGLVVFIGMLIGYIDLKRDRLEAQIEDLKLERHEFSKKEKLLNSTEQHVFHLIQQSIADKDLILFSQVHLGSLIKVSDKALDYYETLKDLNKSLDFVIVEKDSFKPKLVIEFNGPSHSQDGRRVRDKFLKRLFADCHIPLLFLHASDLSQEKKLVERIGELTN